jgi:hypothetical protein
LAEPNDREHRDDFIALRMLTPRAFEQFGRRIKLAATMQPIRLEDDCRRCLVQLVSAGRVTAREAEQLPSVAGRSPVCGLRTGKMRFVASMIALPSASACHGAGAYIHALADQRCGAGMTPSANTITSTVTSGPMATITALRARSHRGARISAVTDPPSGTAFTRTSTSPTSKENSCRPTPSVNTKIRPRISQAPSMCPSSCGTMLTIWRNGIIMRFAQNQCALGDASVEAVSTTARTTNAKASSLYASR